MKSAFFLLITLAFISTGIHSQFHNFKVQILAYICRKYLETMFIIIGKSIRCYVGSNVLTATDCPTNACMKTVIGGQISRGCSVGNVKDSCKKSGNIFCNCHTDLCNTGTVKKTSAFKNISLTILFMYSLSQFLNIMFY